MLSGLWISRNDMRDILYRLLVLAFVLSFHRHAIGAGQAEHVVVLVWDGMRPDYVSAQYTPTLNELARRGTFFQNHHSSYVTSTEVNGAVLATGMFPGHSGILANIQYRPELNWLSPYGTENLDAIRRGDLLTDGRYLGAATIAEILQKAGIPTITAGAKPVVILHDRAPTKTALARNGSITLFRGRTLPRSALKPLVEQPEIGPFPSDSSAADSTQAKILHKAKSTRDRVLNWFNGKAKTPPLSRRVDAWTTRAVVYGLWKERVPRYTLLWLSEPDATQHETGVGSDAVAVAMEQCDRNLALVIQALKEKGILDRTDLFVVSDHGFSTVDRGPDIIASLKRAQFVAGKQFDNPESGDIMVAGLGGSAAFYVFDHHEPTIRRLVEFLQGSDFAGVVFSRLSIEGAFPLTQVRLGTNQAAPDVLVSMRWSQERNHWGAPGMTVTAGGIRGTGTHASLSRFDLHNMLIAAGPDFKAGFVSQLPSGNMDLAPTVLDILGVQPSIAMDGRVLTEAFVGREPPSQTVERETLDATRDLGFRVWHQSLTFSRVGSVIYFDEGNGESRMK